MQLNQVLVVYKQLSTTPHGRIGSRNQRVQQGNDLHLATLDELYEILKDLGIPFEAQNVRQLKAAGNSDLVITVGGDGTVLNASHFIDKQPILGIKSFGKHSVGYFCAATRKTMRRHILQIINNKKHPIKLHRLKVEINGQGLAELALNDVLFAHSLPASTSRYKLIIGNQSEEQKSSGIWISTAAGSTAAISGAGGKVISLTGSHMQYLVREPYSPTGRYKLIKGILSSRIKIISLMHQGTVFIDGGVTQYPAPHESIVTVDNAKKPLPIFWR